MFTQMRAAFGSERARVNAVTNAADEPATGHLTAQQMLEFATINGAHVAGLESTHRLADPGQEGRRRASSTPGMLNVAPVIDPVAAVVLSRGCVQRGHRHRQRRGQEARRQAAGRRGQGPRGWSNESRDYLVGEAGRRKAEAAAAAPAEAA